MPSAARRALAVVIALLFIAGIGAAVDLQRGRRASTGDLGLPTTTTSTGLPTTTTSTDLPAVTTSTDVPVPTTGPGPSMVPGPERAPAPSGPLTTTTSAPSRPATHSRSGDLAEGGPPALAVTGGEARLLPVALLAALGVLARRAVRRARWNC